MSQFPPGWVDDFRDLIDRLQGPEGEFSLKAAAAPVDLDLPSVKHFCNPGLKQPTPLTVTKDGRVSATSPTWGTCHLTRHRAGQVRRPAEDQDRATRTSTPASVMTKEGCGDPGRADHAEHPPRWRTASARRRPWPTTTTPAWRSRTWRRARTRTASGSRGALRSGASPSALRRCEPAARGTGGGSDRPGTGRCSRGERAGLPGAAPRPGGRRPCSPSSRSACCRPRVRRPGTPGALSGRPALPQAPGGAGARRRSSG